MTVQHPSLTAVSTAPRPRTDRPRADRPRADRPRTIAVVITDSPMGGMLVAHGERGVCAVLLGDDRDALQRELATRFPGATFTEGDDAAHAAAARVVAAIDDPARAHDVALDARGTPFQRLVWQALREIPRGTTATYTEIAARIGLPSAARAVAGACAANPLAVVVPCHRVVRSDGGLSGYRWGVERKRALLAREAGG